MATIEEKNERLDVHGTAGSTLFPITALSLTLLLAQYSFSPVEVNDRRVELRGTEATLSRALLSQIDSMDLFRQINRVYDDLQKNLVELDADSKRALYENLWNLYT